MSLILMCSIVGARMQGAGADPFLQKTVDMDSSLLSEVQLALGSDCFQGRLEELRARVKPMFVSLPKDSQNLLSHSTVRYALHRISTAKHGWTITGLEPSIGNFNASAVVKSGILQELLPAHVE